MKVSKLYFYKLAHFILFLSLSTFFIHHFYSNAKILTLIPLISSNFPHCYPDFPHFQPHLPHSLLSHSSPRISTLTPRIPIIPLIPFPSFDSSFYR